MSEILPLDPLPYVDLGTLNRLDAGGALSERYYGREVVFLPRPGFAQDEALYGPQTG